MEIVKSLEISECSVWNHCPTEILFYIFSKADLTTLLTCMQVNNRWRQIAKYVARTYGKWKNIVEQTIVDKGVTFKRKSTLDWSDLYINYNLWRFISDADVMLTRVYKGTNITNGFVYNDNLIVVDDSTIKYYGIAEGDLRRTSFERTSESVQESDYMIVIHNRTWYWPHLLIYGKINADDHDGFLFDTVRSAFMYMLDGDRCYIITQLDENIIEIVVVICNTIERSLKTVILGTYGGQQNAIAAMHICRDVGVYLYIIYKCGRIVKCQTIDENGPVNTIFRLRVPFYSVYGPLYTFHKYNVVLPAREGVEFNVTYDVKWDAIVIVRPNLTCATEHGNVLLLGHSDGKVDICFKRKFKMKNYTPEKCIDLSTFEEFDTQNKAVLWMDVRESNYSHHLFIGTPSRVFHITISHAPLNDVFYYEE